MILSMQTKENIKQEQQYKVHQQRLSDVRKHINLGMEAQMYE